MRHAVFLLLILLTPTLGLAAEDCYCKYPFPWKEWILICSSCVGGCWYFCRRYWLKVKCQCSCDCASLSEIQAEFEKLRDELHTQHNEL